MHTYVDRYITFLVVVGKTRRHLFLLTKLAKVVIKLVVEKTVIKMTQSSKKLSSNSRYRVDFTNIYSTNTFGRKFFGRMVFWSKIYSTNTTIRRPFFGRMVFLVDWFFGRIFRLSKADFLQLFTTFYELVVELDLT